MSDAPRLSRSRRPARRIGEAKWPRSRELEKLRAGSTRPRSSSRSSPKASEPLGRHTPRAMVATVEATAVVAPRSAHGPEARGDLAHEVREVVERMLDAIAVRGRIEIRRTTIRSRPRSSAASSAS